jgi:flagellar basal body-associated protein FliL
MAEEAGEVVAGPGGEAGGSVLKKWGPLALIILLVQVIIAFVLIKMFMPEGGVPEREAAQEELFDRKIMAQQQGGEQDREGLPYYLKPEALEGITVNPAGTNSSRFVVITVELGLAGIDKEGDEVSSEPAKFEKVFGAAKLKVDEYGGRVKAIIIEVIRSKTIDQLESDAVKDVQKEIRQRLNKEVFRYLFDPKKDKKMSLEVIEILFTKVIFQ